MTSGAVIRLRPSELIGWIVSDLKPKRRNLIALTKRVEVASSKSSRADSQMARKLDH